MTTPSSFLSPSRIRPDIRAMLEYHILEDLPLKEACRRAGLKYTKNVSQAKTTKAGKAYVTQLMGRRRVLEEYGIDEPCLATLLDLRDLALKAGSFTAASKASELCIRVAENSDRKWAGGHRDVEEMTREEMLIEIQEFKVKMDREIIDTAEDPLVTELRESMERTQKTQSKREV